MKVAQHTITIDGRTHGVVIAPDQLVLPVELVATETTARAALKALQGLEQQVTSASGAAFEPERQAFRPEKLAGSGMFGGGASRRFVAKRTGALVVPLSGEMGFDARMERAAQLLDAISPLESEQIGFGALVWRHSNVESLRGAVLARLSEQAAAIAASLGLPLAQLQTEAELTVEVASPTRLRVSLGCSLVFGTPD